MVQVDVTDTTYRRIFVFFFLLTFAWCGIIFSLDALRVGDGWVDYLVVKSLSLHMFGGKASGLGEWHPFVLPPLLFHLAGLAVPQGSDYLLAHSMVWLSYFFAVAIPLKRRLSPLAGGLFLGFSFLFLNFPAPLWFDFSDADVLCYAIFYNRYLDVLWGGVFLLYFYDQLRVTAADLVLAAYLLLVAYFSKLSYLAGFGLVFFCMVTFGRQRQYVWPMLLTAIAGLAYELFGHLLQNNYDLLIARSGERGIGGIFKGRMFIPGLLLPAYLAAVLTENKRIYYLSGMVGLSFLVSLMHLGNHNDLGAAPFAILLLCILFRFRSELFNSLIVYWGRRKVSSSLVIAGMTYLFSVGLIIAGSKCLIAAGGVIRDLTVKTDRVMLDEIPGFFVPSSRLARYDDVRADNLPNDVKGFLTGREISLLIGFLKDHPEHRYFVNIYPSLFSVFAANVSVPPKARAWIAAHEFRDKGASYLTQQTTVADFVIERNCNLSPSISGTCYTVRPARTATGTTSAD